MDAYRSELVNALERATSLFNRLVNKEISIRQFVNEYDNFFYYEALDGHEANEQQKVLLAEFEELISLHEKIQTNIVDLVFLGSKEQKQQYLDVGRITPETAEREVQSLANEYDVPKFLKRLSQLKENAG